MAEEEKKLSKKEQRAQRRAEKQAQQAEAEAKEKKESFMQNLFVWGLIIVLGAGLLFFVSKMIKSEDPLISDIREIEITEEDWIKGNPEAPLTLVEYGDFQCPACANAYPVVERILASHPDEVRFVYRHLPFLGPKSLMASKAVEAAGEQGKFYEMYSLLFENQNDWKSSRDTEKLFNEYAEELELDLDIFKKDYSSKEVASRVDNSYKVGSGLGVTSTPTFFLDGNRLNLSSFAQLEEAVEKAVEETKEKGTDEKSSSPSGESEAGDSAQ